MIAELTLPRLGETMETGRVTTWLKQPGEAFRRGETLLEIESDKTVVEMPALSDGVLAEIVVQAGQDADVGTVLCRYEDGREAAASVPAAVPALPEPVATVPEASVAVTLSAAAGGLRATPLARKAARRHNIDLARVTGSGRRGRIQAADVQALVQVALTAPVPAAPIQEAATLTEAVVAGGRIACRDWASDSVRGPRVVLLHGLAGDVQSWAQLAAALMRTGRHVTAIDLPGHGGTAIEANDLDGVALTAASFLEGLDGEPIELVGHSLGGAVAARVARRVPSRVRRLTLLAPIGLDRAIDVDFVRGIVRARASGGLQHLLRRLVVRPAVLTTAQLDALATELSRGRLVGLADTLVDDAGQQVDITGDLRALAMPARLVWGVQDRIIPWTQASQAGSRTAIHLIQDAGHVPHWDQPAEVAALFE